MIRQQLLCGFALLMLFNMFLVSPAQAQTDTEFPEGFIIYGKMHTGMITQFSSYPDLFVGGFQITPQYTVVPHLLRAGITGGPFFAGNKIQGTLGPTVSMKIKSFNANLQGASVGSLGNLHLLIDHLWGTNKQRLLGGGLIANVGNLLSVGVTGHRDYRLNNWWFQMETGIRLSKRKKNPEL